MLLSLPYVSSVAAVDTVGWSASAIAQLEKIQKAEAARQRKEDEMRQLQLQAVNPAQKRTSDEPSDQLAKRVSVIHNQTMVAVPSSPSLSTLQFKAMEDGIKQHAKAQQKSEKLQERQAASLDILVKLQTKAYANSFSRHPRFFATLVICLIVPCCAFCCRLKQSQAAAPPAGTPAAPPSVASTSESAPPLTTGDEDATPNTTPVKADSKKKGKGKLTPTRTSPRTAQLSKRTGGAPKSTLEKLEEALAKGDEVTVNLSNDSDNIDRPDEADVSDDEVSQIIYSCLANA